MAVKLNLPYHFLPQMGQNCPKITQNFVSVPSFTTFSVCLGQQIFKKMAIAQPKILSFLRWNWLISVQNGPKMPCFRLIHGLSTAIHILFTAQFNNIGCNCLPAWL
jgi:hypothetical protein